jgi:AraC-like DNA-binding protein/ribosomal protein L35AE/L33A
MHGVATLEAYLARPIGQYLLGPTYIVWWSSANLNGVTFWGRSNEDHVGVICQALAAEHAAHVAPHASIIDARFIESVDVAAFNRLAEHVRVHRERLCRVVTGQAVLRPDGFAGAVVAGFHHVLDTGYPSHTFVDTMAALRWLGTPVDEGQTTLWELDDYRMSAVGESPIVAALRAHLDERSGCTSLTMAARALRLSPRDLQRKLRDAQTRFKLEQRAAQVRLAKNLLLQTNHELKRIASDVGCASPQHFNALFREVVGESPGRWRLSFAGDALSVRESVRRTGGLDR